MGYILVVDDEKDIRQLIGQILSDEGFQVCLASNSETAMKEINSFTCLDCCIILLSWANSAHVFVVGFSVGFSSFVSARGNTLQ